MKKQISIILISLTFCISSQPAEAFWGAIGQAAAAVGKALLGIGVKAAPKVVLITKSSSAILTKQAVALSTITKTAVVTPTAISIVGKSIAVAGIASIAYEYGINPSKSDGVNERFYKELAAAKAEGWKEYQAKVCHDKDGPNYGVPSNTEKCLDGSEPFILEKPINLDNLKLENG